MKPRAGLSMRTLHQRKKKQRLTLQENCPKRDTILLQEEKRKKKTMLINCVRMMREQPKKKKTRFSLHT